MINRSRIIIQVFFLPLLLFPAFHMGVQKFADGLGAPGESFVEVTNGVEILPVDGDANPDDNSSESVAFSGGEVSQVDIYLNPWSFSSVWGYAVPGSLVTVTAPQEEFSTLADPGCGGCWGLDDVGIVLPGDIVTVSSSAGGGPVGISIPDPFDIEADAGLASVSGVIGGWFVRPVEIHGSWPGGTQVVNTDSSGNFSANYAEMPRGAQGQVIIVDTIDSTEVTFHRPFQALDLILEVNYRDDSIWGFYPPGHTVWLTVTESDMATVKGEATLETDVQPGWEGESGFVTVEGSWEPERPDTVPGDWIFGEVDNGYQSSARIGDIAGELDFALDQIEVTLFAPWFEDPVTAVCEVRVPGGPEIIFLISPQSGSYTCDFQSLVWDLNLMHPVAVTYLEPDGDRVTNIFEAHKAYLPLSVREE